LKGIIFDLDGTLVDTLGDLTDAMNHALEGVGRPGRGEGEMAQFIGDGVFTFAARALGESTPRLVEEVVRRHREWYAKNYLNRTRAYPGMKNAVFQLKNAGFRLGVLTNKDQGVARDIVEQIFGKGVFEQVVGVVGSEPVKPGKEAACKLLAEMGLRAEECAMVGDSGIDMEAAGAAGMRAIGVAWGYRSREELVECGADLVVGTVEEMKKAVDRR